MAAPIIVSRNAAGNCINFLGTTNPAYWNACLSAEVDSEDPTRINVINNVRTGEAPADIYEFYKVSYTEFRDRDGGTFASAQDAADYITAQSNVATNTGQFILSATDTLDFELDDTETTVLLSNGDGYAVNAIRAVAEDSGHIGIFQHTGDFTIYSGLRLANASINGTQVTQVLATAVNELNALFAQSGGASGAAPVITSSLSVGINFGDTLNYELVATNGVGYEWDLSNVPGVTTVAGNPRKLIGGSALVGGTFTIPVKAINYFGVDQQTVTLTVTQTFSNTKSIRFNANDYLGANAALLDATLGRSGNGSGSGDAWTVSIYFLAGSSGNQNQTIWYYGAQDLTNNPGISLTWKGRGGPRQNLVFSYGSANNGLTLATPVGSVPEDGNWRHILVSYDGGTTGAGSNSVSSYYGRFKIFLDGVQQTTTNSHNNYGTTAAISGQNFRVARLNGSQYIRSNGYIDEMAIWNSDQSANISAIYNSGSAHDLSQLATAPTHWWRMGDSDNYPTIQDNVGNADFVMYNQTAADIVNNVP